MCVINCSKFNLIEQNKKQSKKFFLKIRIVYSKVVSTLKDKNNDNTIHTHTQATSKNREN